MADEMSDQENITYQGLLDLYAKDCSPPNLMFFNKEDSLAVMGIIHPDMSEDEAREFIAAHTDKNGVVILE